MALPVRTIISDLLGAGLAFPSLADGFRWLLFLWGIRRCYSLGTEAMENLSLRFLTVPITVHGQAIIDPID
jgi:hypothetical protein